MGGGYKLFYSGANKHERNGVGIVLSKDFKDKVTRINDRVMCMKLNLKEEMVNTVSTYAPQVACAEEDKAAFWQEMDQELREIPAEERVIIGGDLNGNMGRCREVIRRVHGGWGVGR